MSELTAKQHKLKQKGWASGDADDFIKLTPKERIEAIRERSIGLDEDENPVLLGKMSELSDDLTAIEQECERKDAMIQEMADYIYDNGKDEDVTQWIHECRGENTHEVIIAHFTDKVAEKEQKQGQVKEKK